MRKAWFTILLVAILAGAWVPLTGCGEDSSDSGAKTDGAADEPQRIVSLAPSNTEILFALGLEERIVGVTTYCDYPPEAAGKAKIGGFSTPDIEKILSLDPDLVVAANIHKDAVVPELERRGLRVILISPRTVEEALAAMTELGAVTGQRDEALRLTSEIRARIENVSDRLAALGPEQRPRVFYITWHDPLWTLGSDTLTGELMALAGGVNLFADAHGDFQTDLEAVLARNPQVILASTGHGAAGDSPYSWALSEPKLAGTDARREGRVYEVDANVMTRPGPRIAEGVETLARLIHPEIFME